MKYHEETARINAKAKVMTRELQKRLSPLPMLSALKLNKAGFYQHINQIILESDLAQLAKQISTSNNLNKAIEDIISMFELYEFNPDLSGFSESSVYENSHALFKKAIILLIKQIKTTKE